MGEGENAEPEKRIRSSKTLKSLLERDKKLPKLQRDGDSGDRLVKKSKSSTSLSAIFSRPGSSKDNKDEELQEQKNKENQTPPQTPIWAQFATVQNQFEVSSTTKVPLNDRQDLRGEMALYTPRHYSPSKQRNFPENERPTLSGRSNAKSRPKSECLSNTTQASFAETVSGLRKSRQSKEVARSDFDPSRKPCSDDQNARRGPSDRQSRPKDEPPALTIGKRGSRVMAAVAAFNGKSKELPKEPTNESVSERLDSEAIESAFESLLVDLRSVSKSDSTC